MTKIVFEPWCGCRYTDAPFGKRVLILGESHYDPDAETPIDQMPTSQKRLFTQRCIQDQIEGAQRKRFWTNIAATFLNHLPTLADKKVFWHSVAFYNYVQSSAGLRPRMRPTKEQWRAAQAPFVEVLERWKPEVIIVLGFQTWDRLPEQLPDLNLYGRDAKQRIDDSRERDIDTWRYNYSDGSCLAYRIRHPSSGAFSSEEWSPRVRRAISLA